MVAAQCGCGKCYHLVNLIKFSKISKAYFAFIMSVKQRVCLVNVIIHLMLSISLNPKVITLSSANCTYIFKLVLFLLRMNYANVRSYFLGQVSDYVYGLIRLNFLWLEASKVGLPSIPLLITGRRSLGIEQAQHSYQHTFWMI